MGNVVRFAVPFEDPVAATSFIIENNCRVLQSIYVNQLSRFSILDKTEGPALDFVWPVDPPPEGHVQGPPSCGIQTGVAPNLPITAMGYEMGYWA